MCKWNLTNALLKPSNCQFSRPGQQLIFDGPYDLLVIGDDVVFGSRSAIFCCTSDSNQKVVLSTGSNVADNCIVFPGSMIGKNAVLASNSICPPGKRLPEGSVWFGSRGGEPVCLEEGPEGNKELASAKYEHLTTAELFGTESTLTPFGKAIHKREASYFVWPVTMIVGLNVLVKTLIAVFHTLPLLATLHAGASLLYGADDFDTRDYESNDHSFAAIFFVMLFMFMLANIVRLVATVAIELTAKWSIIGRRQPGKYNYDSSSYGQRWELYQAICTIRKWNRMGILDYISGSPYMNWFWRLNGCRIGGNVCLYPTGASPYMPEPDLVSIGDRTVVDSASIVCHLNTKGNFELQKITIGKKCTLRAKSRVQQGVVLEDGAQLLEKTLAMTGETIDEGSVWVGTPAKWWFDYESEKDSTTTSNNSVSIAVG